GEDNSKSFSKCSKPSASFSFDLEEIFGVRLGQANGVLSKLTQPVLKGYHHVSHWIVFAYLAGFIATFVTIVAGLIRFPIARMVILISSMASIVSPNHRSIRNRDGDISVARQWNWKVSSASGDCCQPRFTYDGSDMASSGVFGWRWFVLGYGNMLLLYLTNAPFAWDSQRRDAKRLRKQQATAESFDALE
ncbi:hypothetical protein KXW88_005872, partial [Aspergillus fumigatus]